MKITMIAVLSIATAATALPLAATAHADITSHEFQSPSGNIGCEMMDRGDGAGFAVCKIHDYTWVAPPPGGDCHIAGSDLELVRGDPPFVCFYPNQTWLRQHDNNLPTLAYGQAVSVGTMTCDSEPSGVTCTDSSTGHFFRVSRESYQLG